MGDEQYAALLRAKADDSEIAIALRSRGYLVLAPGDNSPLGKLVRAAVDFVAAGSNYYLSGRLLRAMAYHARKVAKDPTVCAWAEKTMTMTCQSYSGKDDPSSVQRQGR